MSAPLVLPVITYYSAFNSFRRSAIGISCTLTIRGTAPWLAKNRRTFFIFSSNAICSSATWASYKSRCVYVCVCFRCSLPTNWKYRFAYVRLTPNGGNSVSNDASLIYVTIVWCTRYRWYSYTQVDHIIKSRHVRRYCVSRVLIIKYCFAGVLRREEKKWYSGKSEKKNQNRNISYRVSTAC